MTRFAMPIDPHAEATLSRPSEESRPAGHLADGLV
jgi:hypothetical protein